jgi:hypothetical protein
MPITQKFSLVCDEVRQENNGKFFILGMYTPDLAVGSIPFVAPTLTFLSWLESDRPGNFQFRLKLSHLESGATLAEGMGGVGFAKAGTGLVPVRLLGVPFSSPGPYTFTIQFDGQEALITHFSIILAPQAPQAGLGFMGQAGQGRLS